MTPAASDSCVLTWFQRLDQHLLTGGLGGGVVTGVSRLLEDAHGRCRGGMIEACWAGKLCTEGVEEDTAPSSTLCIALTLPLVALFEVECI